MARAFVLVHSPLVGPTTWLSVAQVLRSRGATVVLPALDNNLGPYYAHHAKLVANEIAAASLNRPTVFVAHSGAGPSLPAIAEAAPVRAEAYIFVDAALPGVDGSSRLDRFAVEQATEFRRQAVDGVLPRWGERWPESVWGRLIPENTLREQFRAELRSTPIALYEEPLPLPPDWPEAPCAYVRFSDVYQVEADLAQARGWAVRTLAGTHLHMLAEPNAAASVLAELADELAS